MNRALIPLLVCILIAFRGLADCAGVGLYAFPSQGEIQKTSVFILNGYAESQHTINGLNTKFPVYLKSGNERITLNVIEVHTGEFFLTQALLKPEKPLTPGKKYQLVVENLPEYEHLGNYNSTTRKYDPISYLVTKRSDTEAPRWIKTPQEKDKSLEHFGCGPSAYVNFEMKAEDQSDLFVKATVKSVDTGKETTYYLAEIVGHISIGYGMCSGAFHFSDGANYQVKFTLMDVSGNLSDETEWVAFTKPVD